MSAEAYLVEGYASSHVAESGGGEQRDRIVEAEAKRLAEVGDELAGLLIGRLDAGGPGRIGA